MDQWPPDLQYKPMRTVNIDPHEDNIFTEFDSGPARIRRRQSNSPSYQGLTWQFDYNEFERFKSFYKHVLRNGVKWFSIPLFAGQEYSDHIVRIKAGTKYSAAHASGHNLWEVTAELEIRELATLSELATLMLQLYPQDDLIDWSDRLQIIVNIDYWGTTNEWYETNT